MYFTILVHYQLLNQIKKYFGETAIITGDRTGMHIHLQWIPENYKHIPWSESSRYGVSFAKTTDYCITPGPYEGCIVLGFGNLDLSEIQCGIERLHLFTQEFL